MVNRSRFNTFCFVCLASSLFACASGPDNPDPLTALGAEDGETEAPVDDTATDAERSGDGTIPFGHGMERPTQSSGPTPSIPPEGLRHRVTGVWMARCIITETGSVEACKIIKGLKYSNAHILHIVLKQKYTPVIYEGKPQRVFYTFKITFK